MSYSIVFERKILKRILRKRGVVSIYKSLNIIIFRWAGHVKRMKGNEFIRMSKKQRRTKVIKDGWGGRDGSHGGRS